MKSKLLEINFFLLRNQKPNQIRVDVIPVDQDERIRANYVNLIPSFHSYIENLLKQYRNGRENGKNSNVFSGKENGQVPGILKGKSFYSTIIFFLLKSQIKCFFLSIFHRKFSYLSIVFIFIQPKDTNLFQIINFYVMRI